jgi:hypothetical protein
MRFCNEERIMSGLSLLSESLERKFTSAAPQRQSAAILAACEFAVKKAGLEDDAAGEALAALRAGRDFTVSLRERLDELVEELDEEYFKLKEEADEGDRDDEEWRPFFAKARAAAALASAGEESGEAIYEASFAVEEDEKGELVKLVEGALDGR